MDKVNYNDIESLVGREEDNSVEMECKVCKNIVPKIFSGYTGTNNKDKIWTDSRRRRFNGNVCPQCHSNKVNENNKKHRAEKLRMEGARVKIG